ncbi:hypothetical protein [Archangium sp.]|uniref:hypothetical protein n=1 Tax=Archangium sp. TaxID=1872627 RepID=UPI002D31BAEB|nr:hypothetical protein [Archangium sp.]HYO57321.1 hypothetical protein [Archangium sp.]
MKHALPCLLLAVGCSTLPPPNTTAQDARIARGPWPEVPAIEMPTGDTSIPISLLQDVADALLKRPGAKVCDPVTQQPIVGLSTEYCSTVYVAGDSDSLSWRVTEPIRGDHDSCRPFFAVKDDDYPSSQVWVVGYIHNHPCGAAPSSDDLSAWPTDAFDPFVAMAEVRLIPGNPVPAIHKNTAIEMASALVAERRDGTRIFLRYFPTGEVQQWSDVKARWVTLGTCAPRGPSPLGTAPRCSDGSLQLLRE